MLGSLLCLLGLAVAGGWRVDAGVVPDVTPKTSWTAEDIAWSVSLSRTNGSAVLMGDLVCTTADPTSLVCLRRSDGSEVWRRDHAVVDALGAEEQQALRPRLLQAEESELTLAALRKDYARLRRESRRGGSEETFAQMESVAGQIKALEQEIASLVAYRTPADEPWIGWSSPTPVVDDSAIYALFGNGVLAAWQPDGSPLWMRWLGEPLPKMSGWTRGATASLLRVGDALIVPYGKLRAVSLSTGEDLWVDSASWTHFGTPGVVDVDGLSVLATPDGRLLRASDGTELADELAGVYYTSPVVVGARVYWLGHMQKYDRGSVLTAVALERAGVDGITVRPLYRQEIPSTRRIFASLAADEHQLWTIAEDGEIWSFSAADGSVQRRVQTGLNQVFTSPVIAGDHVFFAGGEYGACSLARDGDGAPEKSPLAATRSEPVFDSAGRMYFRTLESLVAVGP